MARFQNILETIGNTPVVKLNKLAPAGVNVYVKVESFNPMGSVKDRLALAVIEDAEREPVLDRAERVLRLDLDEQVDPGRRQPVEADHGSVADRVEDAAERARHRSSLPPNVTPGWQSLGP